MSRKSLLAVTIVFFLVSVAAAFMAAPKHPEGLYSHPATADLGELAQGQRITTEFRIKNGFSKSITIDAIAKNCGCTDVELHKKSLRPGEDTTLKATLATGRARGRINADLTVFFHPDQGQREWITLRMTAHVVPDIACDPAVLLFRPSHDVTKAEV